MVHFFVNLMQLVLSLSSRALIFNYSFKGKPVLKQNKWKIEKPLSKIDEEFPFLINLKICASF